MTNGCGWVFPEQFLELHQVARLAHERERDEIHPDFEAELSRL